MFVDLIMYTVTLATVGHIILHVIKHFVDLFRADALRRDLIASIDDEASHRHILRDYVSEQVNRLDKRINEVEKK